MKNTFLILFFFAITSMFAQPIARPDTIYFGDGKTTFSLLANDQNAYKITEYSTQSSKGVWNRWVGNATTVRKVGYFGSLLLRTDGVGYFIPNSNTPNQLLIHYTISDWSSGTNQTSVVLIRNATEPEPTDPEPTTPSYTWHGGIGNSSALDYGPTKFKGLRSPTGIAENNGYLYFTKGFVEGNSPIAKTLISNPTAQIEVDRPLNNDFVLEGVSVCSYGGIVYMVGFDPHGSMDNGGYSSKIDCAIIGYDKNDQQITFSSGKSIKCTFQDNAYKSAIGVITNNPSARPRKIKADATYLYVYHSNYIRKYNRITGAFVNQTNYSTQNIDEENGLIMSKTAVTYYGKLICSAQTGPKVDNYTFTPYDFTTYVQKGSVLVASDGTLWVVDAGNSRILHYTSTGIYINQIAYVPMNYNCSVDKNNPERVFAAGMEYKITYPSLKWELVANWTYGLNSAYLLPENTRNFLRCVHTVNGETFGLVDSCFNDDGQDVRVPVKMKFTSSGLKFVKKYDAFASVSFDANGNEYLWESSRNVGQLATLYKNSNRLQSVTITKESALNIDNAYTNVTSDGYLVVFNPNKDHTGFHLSWVKDGKIVYNAMPSVIGSGQKYPPGDAFEIGQNVEYGGGHEVYVVGTKVFVKYIGEFFGGSGGQTNLFFVYENGKLIYNGGIVSWQTSGENPQQMAGNSFSGGVVFKDGAYYYFYNCEHTGAIQCFVIKLPLKSANR